MNRQEAFSSPGPDSHLHQMPVESRDKPSPESRDMGREKKGDQRVSQSQNHGVSPSVPSGDNEISGLQ